MACVKKKFGHCPIKKVEREIQNVSTLLKVAKKVSADASINLVILNPDFLIGGIQEPYNQGNLGSCTANALAFAFVFNAVKQKYTAYMPSRLDIYYNERFNMGGESELKNDDGANISDCEYVLENIGVLPEKSWPYVDDATNESYYTIPQEATDDVRTLALSKNTMYTVNPTDLNSIKLVLTNGYPLVAGILVDVDVFCSQTVSCTGIVSRLPNLTTGNIGGHAVVIVGYTSDGYFLIRNSWGVNWGLGFLNKSTGVYNYDEYNGKMRGYFKVPFSYITNPEITSELYAVTEINNTTDTINSTAYTLTQSLSPFFTLESTIKPLGTLYKSLKIANSKLQIDVYYYLNKNKYIWYFRSIKTINNVSRVIADCEITKFNYVDSVKVGFYNKLKFVPSYVSGSLIALGRNNKVATILSVNTTSGKLSIISNTTI